MAEAGKELFHVLTKQLFFDVVVSCETLTCSEGKSAPEVGERVMTLSKPWLQKILSGEKTLELRSCRAKAGFVWLGAGNTIYGSAKIDQCEVLTPERFLALRPHHGVAGECLPYKKTKTVGLWLSDVRRLDTPVPFFRLRGSCGWASVRFGPLDLQKQPAKEKHCTSDIRPSWPQLQDRLLFEPTLSFTPTMKILRWNEEAAAPTYLQEFVEHEWVSANTLGDGACGMHAAFGALNADGFLECGLSRLLAAESLARALKSRAQTAHVEAVRLALWNELALPAACGKGGPEGQLFWNELKRKCSSAADQVQAIAGERVGQRDQARQEKDDLTKACRAFFLSASDAAFMSFCHKVGYSESEGQEDCFEVRGDRKIVKGTRNTPWAEGPVRTKQEAIRHESPAYDALRTAVFLGNCIEHCKQVLHEVEAEFNCPEAEAVHFALRICSSSAAPGPGSTKDMPQEVEEAVVDAYLATISMQNYFFSYDEIAVVADMRMQSLVVVKEEGANFVPCCLVHHVGVPPVVILVKNAETEHRVRSHFERLAPRMAVTSLLADKETEACNPHRAGEDRFPEHMQEKHDGDDERMNRMISGTWSKEVEDKDRTEVGVPAAPLMPAMDEDSFMWHDPSVDGAQEMEAAVAAVLEAFQRGEDVRTILREIQNFSVEVRQADAITMQARLKAGVAEYATCRMTGDAAVYQPMPIWRTCFLPLAVLFEAWSRTTGMPAVYYVDAFYCLFSSLVKKDLTFQVASFPCRARYWAVGSAAPGSGKSPAYTPMKQALQAVMQEWPDLAPGQKVDGFHMNKVGTHLGAVDRLRDTEGYLVFGAAEGGPLLCPSWPTSGTWNQGTHVNWHHFLDTATGAGGEKAASHM